MEAYGTLFPLICCADNTVLFQWAMFSGYNSRYPPRCTFGSFVCGGERMDDGSALVNRHRLRGKGKMNLGTLPYYPPHPKIPNIHTYNREETESGDIVEGHVGGTKLNGQWEALSPMFLSRFAAGCFYTTNLAAFPRWGEILALLSKQTHHIVQDQARGYLNVKNWEQKKRKGGSQREN